MSLIRISESDDWTADYDRERGMYRVSYFKDGHFVDEYWFDCYEGKELSYQNNVDCDICSSDYNQRIDCSLTRYHTCDRATFRCINLNFCPNCGRKLIN